MMAVSNNFLSSTLDLNGVVQIKNPTALVWGADGRLYVTEVDGDVFVLTVAFGDKTPGDADTSSKFYVTSAVTLGNLKNIPNFNDDGTPNAELKRQVTGIDVTPQYDADGFPVIIDGKPAVTIYVTSSDSRIGAGGTGADVGLDTNSGVITKLVQTAANAWDAIDIARGFPRSEENHALNGLKVIQTLDEGGRLVSERMLVASGGNANNGAPSNNFAGQQEQPLSGAILEIDLDALNAMPVLTAADGRKYVYDLPTLDDPTRAGDPDQNDPFGGNDGLNSAKFLDSGPVRMYSPGYRNAYDVEVTKDGRVYTYDNGSNNNWGGRPLGEAGDNGGMIDFAQVIGYIATNLNNGDGNTNDPINLVSWGPSNRDNLHEITRSDDLGDRLLAAGQGGATTYEIEGLSYVYGGHPNPTRAEGSRAGLLFTPKAGVQDSFLLVSSVDSFGNGGGGDYDEVVAWFAQVEAANPKKGIYGLNAGDLTKKVLAVEPGVAYDIYALPNGFGAAVVKGGPAPQDGVFLGVSGLPADISEIVAYTNAVEGNYLEAGKTDGAIDTGGGSVNGLAEYTSTVLDGNGVKMSGALIAASLFQGALYVIGRDGDGIVPTAVNEEGFSVAASRTTLNAGGGPLGVATLGDDYADLGLTNAFRGSIWVATYNQNGPLIEIFQPNNGAVPLAGQPVRDESDRDGDGVDSRNDPFEFSADNGFALAAGGSLVIDFDPQRDTYPTSLASTGMLGAALDGETSNRDAQTSAENFGPDEQRDGLFDLGGNVLPGGNAPILQIKNVVPGTMIGAANTARDALHTGVRPAADVGRLVATLDAANWIPGVDGGPKEGQASGLVFGDGTQANFLRFVLTSVDGQPGLQVGVEIGDANYTILGRTVLPELASVDVTIVELRLAIDIAAGFGVEASYRLEGAPDFVDVPLNGGAGFVLPAGVLRDVLTGAHRIGDGSAALPSGAAFGVVAEATESAPLAAIDFHNLRIDALAAAGPALAPVMAISAGSADLSATVRGQTITFLSDLAGGAAAQYLTGAPSSSYTAPKIANLDVLGTDLDPMHRAERTAPKSNVWGYAIEVENGEYLVDAYFAEVYHGVVTAASNGVPGKRVFDVIVEGAVVEDDLDIIAEVGTATELIRSYLVTVTDGVLDISFAASVNQATLSGLAIWAVQPSVPADVAPPTVVSISVENLPSVQDGPRFATVIVADETGLDVSALAALDGSELVFSGIVPAAVSAPAVTLSPDGLTATLVYTLTPPEGAWPAGIGSIQIGANAFRDAAGNGSAAATGSFLLDPAPETDVLFRLDFDVAGAPLGVGGFDGVLGGSGAVDASKSVSVADGRLVVNTSNGDLFWASPTASKNDFVKIADLSSPDLTEAVLSARFDNPFNAAFLESQGVTNGVVSDFAQQGVVIATIGADAQEPGQFIKAVFGGFNGNAVQFSSQGQFSQTIQLASMAAASGRAFSLFDVASIEIAILIDKATGKAGQIVTLYDAEGQALGGVRPTATLGFVTAPAQTIPPAIFESLTTAGTGTAFGVTSTDNGPIGSFAATWDYLQLATPAVEPPVNQPPTLSGSDSVAFAENGDGIVAQFIAVDPEGGPLAFTLSGPDAALFEIDGAGALRFRAAPDFEAPGDVDGDNIHDVVVTVSDGTNAVSRPLTIAVTDVAEAVDPTDVALEVFGQIDAKTPDAVVAGAVGAAVLRVTPNNLDIEISNFGLDSFILENVGDKRIAAVFVDVSAALYPDIVFDDDGTGGDQLAKEMRLNSNATVVGGVQPSSPTQGYSEFWLPARDRDNPGALFETGVAEGPSNGGWRGAVFKFNPNTNGGFQPGEWVGFSGDMDPNSIAGFAKNTVDLANNPSNWDAGGVSGAEMIGSKITVLFADGTSATGQLMSDGSVGGAHALITQAPAAAVATLTVNGLAAGENGLYGRDAPSVIVEGPAGSVVRVVLTKGIQPVATTLADAGAIVDARLADAVFKANNAVDFQIFDIALGPDETSRDISHLFRYDANAGGFVFPGSDRLPLGFTASVIDPATGLPAGPVAAPIYLANDGRPVVAAPTDTFYYRAEGERLKVQFEDIAGGADPKGGWIYQDAANGNNPGFQGDGYYYFKSESGATTEYIADQGVFSTNVEIVESGTYFLRVRALRDFTTGGAHNDMYVKIGEDIRTWLPADMTPIVTSNGYAKVFGAGTSWGFSTKFDSISETIANPTIQLELTAGMHTISFAGRSHGYHIDFFELYKDQNPNVAGVQAPVLSASNSPRLLAEAPYGVGASYETVIATSAKETFTGTALAEAFTFETMASSSRSATDNIVNLGPEDRIDLSALGHGVVTFSTTAFNADPNLLLVRTINAGTKFEVTRLNFGGWGAEAFQLDVKASIPDVVDALEASAIGADGVMISIRAGGAGGRTGPAFEVFADGVSLGVRTVSKPVSTAFNPSNDLLFERFDFTLDEAPTQLDIVYFNDGVDVATGVGRDLWVDYVVVDGVRYEAEVHGFFTPEAADPQFGGPREDLRVNGTLGFDFA